MSIYDSLNEQQREAVFHTEGPLLILAGSRLRKNQSPDSQSCIFNRRNGCESLEYPLPSLLPIRRQEKCGNV